MKKSKEELTRIHKAKCRELKKIRASMAENLGLELHQRECTYEGYCSGTCPACRKEEMLLNAALLKKQLEGINLKGRVATAGLATAAALCLTGCTPPSQDVTEGELIEWDGDIAGFITSDPAESDPLSPDETGENCPSPLPEDDTPLSIEQLEGEALPEFPESLTQPSYETPGEYMELEGDVAYTSEPAETEDGHAEGALNKE